MLGMQPSSSKRYSEPLYYPAAGLARAAKNQRGLRFLRVVRTHLLLLFLTLVSIVTAVVLDPIRQALPVAHKLCSGNLVASESDCRRSGAASAKKHSPMCFFFLMSGSKDYLLMLLRARGPRPLKPDAPSGVVCFFGRILLCEPADEQPTLDRFFL